MLVTLKEGCKMRKTWQKPKLIVLFRGRPEEQVLGACKAVAGSGLETALQDCLENAVNCVACDTVGSS